MVCASNHRIPDDLQMLDGIGEATAEKLISGGILTPISLACSTIPELVAIGITKNTAMKIRKAAQERCSSVFGFISGDELVEQFNKREFLTTGSENLDAILGGKGFETQKIYEIYGPEGAGVSNFAHQLACTAFLPPEQGGLGSGTIYIDTEGVFSIKRIQQLAPRFGIDPDEITVNIIKASPPTSDVLLFLVEEQLEKLALQTGYRFFCLDTIASPFRSEYGEERQTYFERNQKVFKILHTIRRIVRQVNGVAIVLNQTEENLTGMGIAWLPWGIKWLRGFHARIRVRLKAWADGLRQFSLENAIDLPRETCEIFLGIQGYTDEKQRRKPNVKQDEENNRRKRKPRRGI